jgi:hypothetical protein
VRSLTALLALLAALTLAACGAAGTDSSSDFEGDERDVASQVEKLQSAALDDDYAEICNNLLAPAIKEQIPSGTTCPKAVRAAIEAADSSELKVTKVDISGDTATATVESGTGDSAVTRTLTLTRPQNNWLISKL